MKRSRTSQEIGDRNITRAAHPQTGALALHIDVDALRLPAPARAEPEAEPVDVTGVNGRPPGGWKTGWDFAHRQLPGSGEWEQELIEAARMRERRLEWRP